MNMKASSSETAFATGADTLLTSSPPRPVRMKRYARSLLLFLVFLLVVDGYFVLPLLQLARLQKVGSTVDPGNLFVAISIPLATAFYVFTLFRQRALVRDGAAAMGHITETRTGRWYNHLALYYGRVVDYEFMDSTMQTVHGTVTDRDRSWHQGMAVPVFYDPNDSGHNVPLCASFYEVPRVSTSGRHNKAITREK